MAFLGRDQRETLRQIKAHLMAKYAQGAGAGPVFLFRAVFQHMAHEIEILLHRVQYREIRGFYKGFPARNPQIFDEIRKFM